MSPSIDRTELTPSISCVMPAFNEAGTLARLVPQVLERLLHWSPKVELVIVNDGSRDASAQVIDSLCRQHPVWICPAISARSRLSRQAWTPLAATWWC